MTVSRDLMDGRGCSAFALKKRTCSSRLLVVVLHGLGQTVVNDEPHVGFVDPHSERNRRHHHLSIVKFVKGIGNQVEVISELRGRAALFYRGV